MAFLQTMVDHNFNQEKETKDSTMSQTDMLDTSINATNEEKDTTSKETDHDENDNTSIEKTNLKPQFLEHLINVVQICHLCHKGKNPQ
jgi:hypothetical protein